MEYEKIEQLYESKDWDAPKNHVKSVIEGLIILTKWTKDSYCISASHEQISVGSVENISEKEVIEVFGLGWFWDSEAECFCIFT